MVEAITGPRAFDRIQSYRDGQARSEEKARESARRSEKLKLQLEFQRLASAFEDLRNKVVPDLEDIIASDPQFSRSVVGMTPIIREFKTEIIKDREYEDYVYPGQIALLWGNMEFDANAWSGQGDLIGRYADLKERLGAKKLTTKKRTKYEAELEEMSKSSKKFILIKGIKAIGVNLLLGKRADSVDVPVVELLPKATNRNQFTIEMVKSDGLIPGLSLRLDHGYGSFTFSTTVQNFIENRNNPVILPNGPYSIR